MFVKNNTNNQEKHLLDCVKSLCRMWHSGLLGGDVMPEDQNPNLNKGDIDNYHYFTLPMALNYQRNSYKLWASAKETYRDSNTRTVFNPKCVISMSNVELKDMLTKYKVAVQPIKQTEIWMKLCNTICNLYDGDIRNLFISTEGYIPKILKIVQDTNKRDFPYLSGQKICNYWLYVTSNYTDAFLTGKEALNIAPDTHILQSSVRLGIITEEDLKNSNVQKIVSDRWKTILKGTGIAPIDIHTPLWLWSRNGFIDIHN